MLESIWEYARYILPVFLLIGLLLPYMLAPFLPERYKSKTSINLDCTVEKAFDILTENPDKCPMSGKQNLSVTKDDAGKKGMSLKWTEVILHGNAKEVIIVEQTVDAKPKQGKTVRIVRTSKHETKPIEAEWQYEIEPAGDGKCRITLDGYTDVKGGWAWEVPLLRFEVLMRGKKGMIEHLNMLAEATGSTPKLWMN